VIVDCYADWCEPCKELTPKLVQLVQEAQGAIRLAHLNIENNPQLAEQMRVTSIPTVFAFHNGRAVDAFTGLQKDDALKAFVAKLLKRGGGLTAAKYLEEADKLLSQKNIQAASQMYSDLLQRKNLEATAQALAGLARCALQDNQLETAQLVKQIKEHHSSDLSHPEVKKALAAIELANATAPNTADQQQLLEKIQKICNPDMTL